MTGRLATALALLVALGAVAYGQNGRPPVYDGERITDLAGVDLRATRATDPQLAWTIASICSTAWSVYHDQLGLTGPDVVDVNLSTTEGFHPSVVTDRQRVVHVVYSRQFGIGELQRLYPKPVGTLCKAVAELFSPHRVPGLERYLSALWAIPAVADSVGEAAWQPAYPYRDEDGETLFRARGEEAGFLPEHPDWAAAHALCEVADALGPEWLAQQLQALNVDGAAAFDRLADAAVAEDPALAEALAPYREATALQLEADGSLLISSFETDDEVGLFTRQAGATLGVSEEWATDGRRCGVFEFQFGDWPTIARFDEDWRYKDWSGFGSLELDVHNPGDADVVLVFAAHDAPDRGHGWLRREWRLGPGETQHCVFTLQPPGMEAPWNDAVYWEGRSRLAEISQFALFLSAPPQLPATLWVDDIRLCP